MQSLINRSVINLTRGQPSLIFFCRNHDGNPNWETPIHQVSAPQKAATSSTSFNFPSSFRRITSPSISTDVPRQLFQTDEESNEANSSNFFENGDESHTNSNQIELEFGDGAQNFNIPGNP